MADRYRHLISGEVDGKPHEPGDLVDVATPPRKLKEWLDAGIIERDKTASKAKKTSDPKGTK